MPSLSVNAIETSFTDCNSGSFPNAVFMACAHLISIVHINILRKASKTTVECIIVQHKKFHYMVLGKLQLIECKIMKIRSIGSSLTSIYSSIHLEICIAIFRGALESVCIDIN